MSKNLKSKLIFGILFAVIFGLAAGVISAQADNQLAPTFTGDCNTCHYKVREVYEVSHHGEAGIDCTICHSPVNTNHPQEVMPTDVSSRLCATCHKTVAEELENSVHGQKDLTCVRCHNSHTAALRAENVQTLCDNCHTDVVHDFSYSAHSQADILCTDCHQQTVDGANRVGTGNITHTFIPNLATCTECHKQDMHNPHTDPCAEGAEGASDSLCDPQEVVQAGLTIPKDPDLLAVPEPAGPFGFIVIGVLVGMAAGMILAPWLENLFKKS